ncbi:MAG: T9SS type A sorting domain-containing protein [Candidatus Delongbacteria bacterium]
MRSGHPLPHVLRASLWVPLLLSAGLAQAAQTPPLRPLLEAKAALGHQSLPELEREYASRLPVDAAAPTPGLFAPGSDDALYAELKAQGAPIPAWLQARLFPLAGRTQHAERDGGDGPDDATPVPDVSWGTTWTDTGTTVDKTDVLLNPLPAPPVQCDFGYFPTTSFSAPDAWYLLELEEATQVTLNSCRPGTTYDTALAILDSDLVPVAADDDIPVCDFGSWRSYLACCLEPGQYYVVVDGYSVASTGDYELDMSFAECPPDPCIGYQDDTVQAELPGVLSGDTSAGWDVLNNDGLREVGFDIDAGQGGIFTFDPCSENTVSDVRLYLYTANPCAGGTLVASSTWGSCTLGNPTAASLSNLTLAAGSYHLLVSSGGTEGPFELNVYTPCEGYNDQVATFTAPGLLTGTTSDGVNVYSGPGPDKGVDVTLPAAGFWDFDACQAGTATDVALYLFSTNPCEGGELLAQAGWSNCQVPAGAARLREVFLEAGTYHLMVSHTWTGSGAFEIQVAPTPDRPTQGGPDELGYTWISSLDPQGPEYGWVEIADTGQQLALSGDDGAVSIELPWAFPYYDFNYTSVQVSTNGYLAFTGPATPYWNGALPSSETPNDAIYALWNDLFVPGGESGALYTWDDPANGRFIVEWHNVQRLGQTANNSFQIILHSDGAIDVQYLELDPTDLHGATAGIENADGSIGLLVNYDGEGGFLGNELLISYVPQEGDFRAPWITHDAPLQDTETELPGGYPITAQITDETGVAQAHVLYALNGGAEQSVAMTQGAGDSWTASIPHQPAGTQVTYRLRAVDATEAANTRFTLNWGFSVVSYQWPPFGLSASDGLLSRTTLSWFHPVNPGLLSATFGADWPRSEAEAVQRLMREQGQSKEQALATWQALTRPAEREFIVYHVYRDGEPIAETTESVFEDNAGLGSEMDVTYTYTVTAEFTAGESAASNADTGYWGSPPSFGGPDAFGYMWINSENPSGPEFEWVDISGTGTPLGLTDDSNTGPIAIGFDFPFYDQSWSELYVGSNGYVTFGAGFTSLSPQPFPTPSDGWSPDNLIAMFWDDLNPGAGGTVYTRSEPERFIVQFQAVPPYGGGGGSYTFQLILNAGGIIQVNYLDMNENDLAWAGAGIENSTGTIGLQYYYQGEGALMADNVALIYTPSPSCGPVECTGTPETEPNEGWNDGNASFDVIRCFDTRCGTVLADGTNTDTDWYLYTHFGGDIIAQLRVSEFDGRLSLREFAQGGQVLASANTFPRCFNETITFHDLPGGAYYLVVEHDGDPDITTPQSYELSLTCLGDPCSGHVPVECVGTPEVEPNEGWNATPPNSSYGEIALGETVCGTTWANAGQRDMDWFRFTLTEPRTIHLSCAVDALDAALFLTDLDPAGSVLANVDDNLACAPEELTYENLPAGQYFVVIGNNSFDGVPVPQNYSLTLGLAGGPEDPCDNYVDVGNFHDIYQAARPAPLNTHHDGTGCPGAIDSPGRDEVIRLVLSQTTDLQISMHGDGDADEVLLLLGNCAQPESSCGAAADNNGAGPQGEILTLPNVPAGDYYVVADFAGQDETHSYGVMIIDMESGLGEGRELTFAVEPNYPNPFNPSTTIHWTQPALAAATLSVHDLRGALVEELDLGVRGAGRHQVTWDATRFGSGVYFCTLTAGGQSHTLKAVLLK